MSSPRSRYKVVMEDDSELFFEAAGPVNVGVEIRVEDENVWRVLDAEGCVVFAGQKVRYIAQTGDEREGKPEDIP